MLTPAKIQAISDPIEEVYIHIVDELMVNIGKHLTSPTWTHTAAWEIQKLSEMGQLTQENAEIINKWIKQLPEEVRDAMEETRRLALEKIEKDMEKAVRLGKLPEPLADSTVNVLNEYSQQAIDQLNLVNTVMLQSSVQQYQRAVQLTKEEYDKLMQQQEQTQIILNEAAGSVATGIETREKALRRAITRISDEGLTGFIDRAGHHWSPEAYVNMDIRTTVHNTAIQSVKNFMTDYNTQVFQVSSHAAARPGCYPYQGKFYSWDNSAGEIELGNGNMVRYEPLNVTTYGQPAGLFGINCGHYPIPIVPGVTIPHGADNIQPKEENDKAYEESQVQRSLERQIREAKRVVEMAGDKASPEMKQKVKDAQEQMRDFIARTGRTRRYDREKIGGLPKGSGTQTASGEKVNTELTSGKDSVDKIEAPKFTPAKTQQEAEEFAKAFAKNVAYKGISLDNCNEINKTLNTLTTKYPIRQLDQIKQNGRMKAVARANFQELEINGKSVSKNVDEMFEANQNFYRASINAIKERYPSGRIPPDMQKQIERYEARLKFNRWSVAGTYGASGTITHEYGHIIADQYWGMINGGWATSGYLNDPGNTKKNMQYKLDTVFRQAKSNGDIYNLSKYGATDRDEFFAEAFCAREHGEKLPDYIEDIVKEICNGSAL